MREWRYPFAMLGIIFVLIGYAFWPKTSAIPVLIYHDIATSTQLSDSYTVERSLLARELDHLRSNGYTPMTFFTAETLRAERKLPKKPIIITFDDALPGQLFALDELRSRTIPATFFIPSSLVGDAAHLRWDDVRAIAAAGMEIGGHTANHVRVGEINETGLENEIVGDKNHIEAELGKTITVFAYPFREPTDVAQSYVDKAGYAIVRDTPAYAGTVMTNSFDAFLRAI